MAKTTKEKKITKENYKYYGLGFPVILEKVEVTIIDGEEYYDIDFQNLKYGFLAILMIDPNIDFLGGMIKFVRQSLELSMEEMATRLDVVKSTISKWEVKNEEVIKLTDFQKFKIKQDIKSYLDKIMEIKIEKVLDKKDKKKTALPSKPKPMRVPTNLPLSAVFDSNQIFV